MLQAKDGHGGALAFHTGDVRTIARESGGEGILDCARAAHARGWRTGALAQMGCMGYRTEGKIGRLTPFYSVFFAYG
ncbi:MAG: hypothetical protein OJF49_002372 [Ktedonobacterales bacterium]|jgi:hypothetical protein|nr:MAG: hypothetical protein OJF49_002372 [Ktedonobacterales bacterium]